ncbi:MAG TPA: substrate-binding domain-containing protein [Acidobacteriaceae bacterium]|nr:substrate-binding domain-containing protein [Acidobacteriaceae bacterium]
MKIAIALLLFGLTCAASAQDEHFAERLAPYTPDTQVTGTVRTYGNNYIPKLVKAWEDEFNKLQPGVRFENNLPGTEAAMAGLYGGVADVIFVGREGYRPELDAFRDRFGYEPLGIEISSGSFNTPHKTFSLQVFVHARNSIHQLTMEQCEGIFGAGGHGVKRIRTWGELGVMGGQASHPIHVYGYNFDTGMAGYFNRVVLHDSGRWNEDLKDFDNGHEPNGEVINAGVYILQALAKDPDGIAFANVLYANPEVKTVALARKSGGPYIEPSRETVWSRAYPISRFTMAYANKKPGQPLDPAVREFLRFIVSRQGMALVEADGAYLPINPNVQRRDLEQLR